MDIQSIFHILKNHKPFILGHEQFFKSAVLLPLVEKEDGLHILFEVRSLQLNRQPGEICFPGGKKDEQDATEKDTAIRETTEELGILTSQIKHVYPIDFMATPFGMIVYPFVGVIDKEAAIQPNEEVEEVFTVPLSYFLETKPKIHYINFKIEPEENFPYDLIVGGKDYDWRARKLPEIFYQYDGKVIWGLTARILTHFVELMKKNDGK